MRLILFDWGRMKLSLLPNHLFREFVSFVMEQFDAFGTRLLEVRNSNLVASLYVGVWVTNDYHWTHFASVYYCTKLSESLSERLFGFVFASRYRIPAVSEFVYADTLGHRFC